MSVEAYLSSLGIDQENFQFKLETLAKKWLGEYAPKGDCDGKRIVNRVLLTEINKPLFIAIIADRLDLFVRTYEEADRSWPPMFYLELACLCGATNVVNYLLGNNLKPSGWKDSKNILPYAISSGNNELALQLARTLHALSVTNPGLIHRYSFGNMKLIDQIEAIFSEDAIPGMELQP